MAKDEGRQLQALVHEALCEYVERKQSCNPRQHVLKALDGSILQYDELYHELAK